MRLNTIEAAVVLLWLLLITGVMLESGNEQPCQSVLFTREFPANVVELPVILELTNNSAYQTELYLNLTAERELRFLCDTHIAPCNGSYNVSRDHSYTSFLYMTSINETHISMTLTRGMRVEDMAYIQLIERLTLMEDLANKTYCHHYITILDSPGKVDVRIGVNAASAHIPMTEDTVTYLPMLMESNNFITLEAEFSGMFPNSAASLYVNNRLSTCKDSARENHTSGLFHKLLTCSVDQVDIPAGHLVVVVQYMHGECVVIRHASAQEHTEIDTEFHVVYITVICILVVLLICAILAGVLCIRRLKQRCHDLNQQHTECCFLLDVKKKVMMYSFANYSVKCLTDIPSWVDACTSFFQIGPYIVLCGACLKKNSCMRYEYNLITGKAEISEMELGIRTITTCQTDKNTVYIIGGLEWSPDDTADDDDQQEAKRSNRCIKYYCDENSQTHIEQMSSMPESLYWQILVYDPKRSQIHCFGGAKVGLEVLGNHYCYDVAQNEWHELPKVEIPENHTEFRASLGGGIVHEDTIYFLTPNYEARYQLGKYNSKLIRASYADTNGRSFKALAPFLAEKGDSVMVLAQSNEHVDAVILRYNIKEKTFSNPVELCDVTCMRNQCLVTDKLPISADCEEAQQPETAHGEGRPLIKSVQCVNSHDAEAVV